MHVCMCMAYTTRITLTMSPTIVEKIDSVRGDTSRSLFIQRLVERFFESTKQQKTGGQKAKEVVHALA